MLTLKTGGYTAQEISTLKELCSELLVNLCEKKCNSPSPHYCSQCCPYKRIIRDVKNLTKISVKKTL